ncbi:hypothetical protein BH09ACT11_BH09ACT11_15970 [soil metagenome]
MTRPGLVPAGAAVVVPLVALGVRVDVEVSPEFEAGVRRAWSRCLAADSTEPASVRLPVNDADEATALHTLSMTMNRTVTDARGGTVLTLHGAALADASGNTVLLVAQSGTGKTTLARTLGPRWGYLSDESAGVGPDGVMVAYPKPLSIVTDDWRKDQLSPDELGLGLPAAVCVLRAIVLIDRDPDQAQPVMTEVDLMDALPRLAKESFQLARHDRPLHVLATAIEQARGVRHIRYAEAATLDPLLRELVS